MASVSVMVQRTGTRRDRTLLRNNTNPREEMPPISLTGISAGLYNGHGFTDEKGFS